jgi:hypothetical protein
MFSLALKNSLFDGSVSTHTKETEWGKKGKREREREKKIMFNFLNIRQTLHET